MSSETLFFGSGNNRFSVHHDWLKFRSGPLFPGCCDVQGLAEDPETGELYVTFAENIKSRDVTKDPAVFVFDADGKFVRRFAPEAHAGGHGIRFIKIGSDKFVYVACVQTQNVYKYYATTGELLMTIGKPEFYGTAKFKPTNVALLEDGRFVVTDGYGSNHILLYSASGELLSHFNGTENAEPGPLSQPHGINVFDGDKLIITDRKNERLILATLNGNWQSPIRALELSHPCNVHIRMNEGNPEYLIPGLWHSVGIYDYGFNLQIRLGDGYGKHRSHGTVQRVADRSTDYRKGLEKGDVFCRAINSDCFLYPHDAIWTVNHSGQEGNILVCEWNYHIRGTGVTLLRRCPE